MVTRLLPCFAPAGVKQVSRKTRSSHLYIAAVGQSLRSPCQRWTPRGCIRFWFGQMWSQTFGVSPFVSLSLERSHAFAHLCAPQNNVFFFFVSSSWLLNSACDQVAHESCAQSRFGPNYFSFAMKKYPPLNLVLADTFIALGNFLLAVFVIVFKWRNNSKNMAGRDTSVTFNKTSLAHSAWSWIILIYLLGLFI